MHGFTLRNPFLWRTQTVISQIWNKEHFAKHLMEVHNIDIDRYINVSLNKHCALIRKRHYCKLSFRWWLNFNINNCGKMVSKCFVIFRLTGTKEQLEWDNDFLKSEMSSNEDFKMEYSIQICIIFLTIKLVKVMIIVWLTLPMPQKQKITIGAATNDVWALYMVGQVYLGLKKNNPEKTLMHTG